MVFEHNDEALVVLGQAGTQIVDFGPFELGIKKKKSVFFLWKRTFNCSLLLLSLNNNKETPGDNK